MNILSRIYVPKQGILVCQTQGPELHPLYDAAFVDDISYL